MSMTATAAATTALSVVVLVVLEQAIAANNIRKSELPFWDDRYYATVHQIY